MLAFPRGRWLVVFGVVLGGGGCAPMPAVSRADPGPRLASSAPFLYETTPRGEPAALPSLARSYIGMPPPKGESAALPRGVGRMSARIPGTDFDSGGVRLARHRATVTIQDGFARTEVEEEFHNDTSRVLEGRFEFALPPRASVSRLALKVGPSWVEAEMVDRHRAREIFDKIVDDTVRPRDPALLEKNAGQLSLRVFPIPANSSRHVVFAYDEPLERTDKGLRYAYPLSATAPEIARFSIDVTLREAGRAPSEVESSWGDAWVVKQLDQIRVRSNKTHFVPDRDFVIDYPTQDESSLPLSVYRSPGHGYFSVRIPIRAAAVTPKATRRAIVIDKSASQTDASLADARALVVGLLRAAPRTRFVLLACDSACVAYPKRGSLETSGASIEDAREWLANLDPSGASDVAGAIEAAGRRLGSDPGESAQVLYVGDATPSAGDLEPTAIGERVHAALHRSKGKAVDLRFVGAGREVDGPALENLAALAGGSSHSLSGSNPLNERVARVVGELGKPVLASPRIEIDDAASDVFPRIVANQLLGGELFVIGRFGKSLPKTVTLAGTVDGQSFRATHSLKGSRARSAQNGLLPRLWAEARIAELERAGDESAKQEIRRISVDSHVLSHETSLIALENDAMFQEFGITRAHGPVKLVTRAHRTRAPQVRMGMTYVSGRMPPESIRRVVRQNFGRFRACYHRGLLKRASLEGRVVLRFLIDRRGDVIAAEDGESTLADANVVKCMVEESRALRFPAPDEIVRVEYPLQLSPSEAPESLTPERAPFRPHRLPAIDSGPAPLPPSGITKRVKSQSGNDEWIDETPFSSATVVEEVARQHQSRRMLEWLIRDHLSSGRFEAAHFAAKLFAEQDPDNGRAFDLLAETSAVNDDRERLLAAIAVHAEIEPRSVVAQETAARGFAWAGESTRACAHFRAAASLPGATGRAHDAATACETRHARPSELTLEPAPALSVDLECASGCPALVVVSSSGAVFTEASNGKRGVVRVDALDDDAYRILAVGGAPDVRARIRVKLLGESASYPIVPNGPRTVAIVRR